MKVIDYYGTDADYIHLKFGDMRKAYNFTKEFEEKYPNFCAEYKKYWQGDESCRFKSALEIAQYIDLFDVPINLYFNYTDTPVRKMSEVYEYFIREYAGITTEADGSFRANYRPGLDGENRNTKEYLVILKKESGEK